MDKREKALKAHKDWAGKIEINCRAKVTNREELAVAYTPGVAEPCLEIQKDINLSYTYTRRANTVAVVTDGTAVLGLGDIGPEAGMPVMEGKCVLFKEFGGIDAIPLCIRSKDVDEIVNTVKLISGSFGGINLEDISAPRCVEIEKRLKEECDIPVFHDDQHGTAIVVYSALINALKVVGKKQEEVKIVVNGAGSAGCAITNLLLSTGFDNITVCDRHGILVRGDESLNPLMKSVAERTNKEGKTGLLADALNGADIFIGVSAPNILTEEMIKSMAEKPIVFALANPNPEIMPDKAIAAGAAVVATGRSDFPNQVNNVLAFPGIFRGALDVRASDINDEMKIAAAKAIASVIDDKDISSENIITDIFNEKVLERVSEAVKEAARRSGVARI